MGSMKRFSIISFLIFFAIAGFVLSPLVFFQNGIGAIRKVLTPFSAPLVSGVSSVPTFWHTFSQLGGLIKENLALKDENSRLETELIRLAEVERENRALKEEMQISPPSNNSQLVFAKIIGRSPSSFNQTIFLGAGENQNVKKGDPVLSRGFLIGKVEKVDKFSSQAILIGNHRFLAPVILAQSRALGLMRGGLQGVKIEQIPSDAQIALGETVLTSEISDDLPGNFPVGKIVEINSRGSDIFQTATLSQPFSANSLETVLIYVKQ